MPFNAPFYSILHILTIIIAISLQAWICQVCWAWAVHREGPCGQRTEENHWLGWWGTHDPPTRLKVREDTLPHIAQDQEIPRCWGHCYRFRAKQVQSRSHWCIAGTDGQWQTVQSRIWVCSLLQYIMIVPWTDSHIKL